MADRLTELAERMPPPAAPVETGDEGAWAEVEKALGTPLPADYKAFTVRYGSGKVDDFLFLFSPFAPEGDGNLVFEKDRVLEGYKESRDKHPDRYPLPPFPEPGGLLPLGRTDNGDELYWRTEGEPDIWPVMLLGSRSPDREEHPGGVVAFLADLVAGRLDSKLLPSGLGEGGHAFAPFD
jgi:hypothetical protein